VLCEEFACLPSEAYREWLRQPVGFLEDVIEARAYRQAKAMTDAADTPDAAKRLPQTPLFKLVQEIDRDLAGE
jgi:hypothetical protein